jgi:hypothetical protein
MTLISDVFVIHRTAGRKDSDTDAGFELIVKGPGGFEASAAFENLPTDEREKLTVDMYRFIFDEPFDWAPSGWTVSMRMTSTKDGWLPSTIFVLGKVASDRAEEWVVMGAHRPWPKDKWFDRGPPAADEHPEHVISGFTWQLGDKDF